MHFVAPGKNAPGNFFSSILPRFNSVLFLGRVGAPTDVPPRVRCGNERIDGAASHQEL